MNSIDFMKAVVGKSIEYEVQKGVIVKIRSLTTEEASDLAKVQDEDSSLANYQLVELGLVEPKLSQDEIKQLPPGVFFKLADQISIVSGLKEFDSPTDGNGSQ
jgi:hypothetical protein